MSAPLRRLPPRIVLLSAPSRALRTTPSCVRQRTLCTACAPPNTSNRPRTAPPTVFPPAFAAQQTRRASAVAEATVENDNAEDIGPIQEYDRRVASGLLRNDEHQRGIIQSLQHLHEELRHYEAEPVIHPTLESVKPNKSLFSWFGNNKTPIRAIPGNLPRGLYLYGDVGCGKTMLMDLFYDTLPQNVRSKTRIHFHNFMQGVHQRLHKMKLQYGSDVDCVPFVAAEIAEQGNVLCFDEFQCTDVADAMILRRLLESLMSHGVVLVTTSNRHPDELYKNGIQRDSFIPAIQLLKKRLHVINLDSTTDYRKIPRPASGVYHAPLDAHAASHAERWFRFLGDPDTPEPHREVQRVWGRDIVVPRVSGRCAWFTFDELIGQPTSAADYLELMRSYDAFVVTAVPGMTFRQRDLARRFITFVDAVYESHAKLVLTSAVPLQELFVSRAEIRESFLAKQQQQEKKKKEGGEEEEEEGGAREGEMDDTAVEDAMSHMLDGLENNVEQLAKSNLFSGDEEAFAFARALSRLSHMGSKEWVERGMGLESQGGKQERDSWARTRSRQMEDSM
ncbi:AFG1-like ATPase-domain-containing protein [Chaetomidium leptoderma]|uniref:AFG1-like ATPase-domain-containing protein n=1 Tax=Chaetomidium leptoderma TaxID=669021 RepID=A0AAN6VMM0_9PEZI|nr:AFG1-like ATPase-domain-containing protein [Chaetomidium leptoderma]